MKGKGRGAALGLLMCVAATLAPAAAQARIRQAESVLPPGQSGFVSVPGVASGTGSPHLTDQADLFTRFRYKPADLGEPAVGESESPRPGVRITRDAYGVPSIDADSDADAWFGVGYAVAQDRLFQLEAFRRATSGHLAEILGRDSLESDIVARRDYYTDAELDEQLAKVPPKLLERTRAYRDGINAWISEVMTTRPDQLPGEFAALGILPPRWTLNDSVRIGIFLARTVPSGDGEELANAAALESAGPQAFNELLPLRTPGRLPTIPPSEGRFPSQPGRTRADEQRGFEKSKRLVAGLELPRDPKDNAGTVATASDTKPLFGNPGGSYMWGIRTPNRSGTPTYLFNGPQLGFSIPELFVEYEVHSPDQDVRGVSAAGVPVVGIGHNKHLAWGFTSGLSDEDDLYAEKLTGEETYMYKGEERQMDCRNERFDTRESPTSLTDLPSDPEVPISTQTVRLCRTVHGPVQERIGDVAYARRYAIFGRELETIVGLSGLNDANTVEAADSALRKVTWNENVIATDDRGGLGYWHPGLHPLRPRTWDERLPYPGTGEAEWRGFLTRDQRPHVVNPKRNWLAQWNNVPSIDWTSGDGPARERLTGALHRVGFLDRLVSRVANDPGYRENLKINRHKGRFAQQFPLLRDEVRAAAREAKGPAVPLFRELRSWNGNYDKVDDDGTVEPGLAIWEELKDQAAAMIYERFGPTIDKLDGGASRSHSFDIRNVEAYAFRTLEPAKIAIAGRRAAKVLRERFGSSDPDDWRDKRLLYELGAMGAGQTPPIPFFDRGTWEQSVELGP